MCVLPVKASQRAGLTICLSVVDILDVQQMVFYLLFQKNGRTCAFCLQKYMWFEVEAPCMLGQLAFSW